MQNFEYCVPTKVVFGRDTESRCGELVRECGGTHALVVYGGGSAVRSGLLGRCTDSLKVVLFENAACVIEFENSFSIYQ